MKPIHVGETLTESENPRQNSPYSKLNDYSEDSPAFHLNSFKLFMLYGTLNLSGFIKTSFYN